MPVKMWSVSAGIAHFIVRVNEKLWVGFELFENCNSLFGTHGTVFGSESFDQPYWVALPDDVASFSSTLVEWGHIFIKELSCKVFGA